MLTLNEYVSRLGRKLTRTIRPSSNLSYAAPVGSQRRALAINLIERSLGIHQVAVLFEELKRELPIGEDVFGAALKKLNIRLDYDQNQLAKIPSNGPLIFISNHAFGLLDGITLSHFGMASRGDVQTFLHSANALVHDEQLGRYFLPIDFNETKEAIKTTIASKREAIRRLRDGGAVVIFPSGGTALAPRIFDKAVEKEWKLFAAKMVHMTEATVIPTYFPGQNSFRFHMADKVSSTLRLALVVHELWRRRNSAVRIEIGNPIPFSELAHIKGRRNMLNHIRETVYGLAEQGGMVNGKR